MKWYLGMALSGYGLMVLIGLPYIGYMTLDGILRQEEQPLWESVLVAAIFVAICAAIGYGIHKLGRWLTRRADKPESPGYTIGAWVMLLAGVTLITMGIKELSADNPGSATSTAISTGFMFIVIGLKLFWHHE